MNANDSMLRFFITFSLGLLLGLGISRELPAQADPERTVTQDTTSLQEAALAAYEEGTLEEALAIAHQAYRIAPQDPRVIFLKAMMLSENRRYHEAVKLVDDLAERVPSSRLPVLGQSSEWLVKQGAWSEAERRLKIVLNNAPESVMVHRALARLFVRQGRRNEAEPHLRLMCRAGDIKEDELRHRLCLLHPVPSDAVVEDDLIGELAWSRTLIADGDWEGARSRLESIAKPSPGEVALLGRTLAQLADEKALASWITKTETNASQLESYSDYWFAIASHTAAQGDHRTAVQYFCETVLRDQTDQHAYLQLSKSLEQLGETEKAKEAERRVTWIATTQSAAKAIANNSDATDYEPLVEALKQLRRPLEAITWQGGQLLQLRTSGKLTEEAYRAQFGQLIAQRKTVLSGETSASKSFICCEANTE